MKNRTLPYGYCCKDGVIVIEPQESKVLKQIYAAYLDGSSMMTIAEQLNREKIEYRDGVTGWNKGRLKHLIDNTKYLGTEVYPSIVDQVTYEKIQKTKYGRNTQKNMDKTQDIFKLTVPVRCPTCGDRMRRRHDSRCKCQERWTCENTACRLRIEIPDAELLTARRPSRHGNRRQHQKACRNTLRAKHRDNTTEQRDRPNARHGGNRQDCVAKQDDGVLPAEIQRAWQ